MVGRAVGIAAASWSALSSSLFNCCHTAAPSLLSASSSLALSSCGSILSSSSISSHQLGSAVCCYGTGDEKIYSSQWERYSKERQPKLLNQLEGSKQRSAIKRKKDWRSVKQATVEAGKQSREAQTDRKQCKSSAGLGLLSEDDKALYSRSDWIYQVDRVEDIQDDSFLDAVVKVYCTHSEPDYSLPWQKRRQFHSTGRLKGLKFLDCYARYLYQKGDVILRFDGIPVANEGTVPFRSAERIDFHFLVTQKFSGESAEVEILRDGKVMKVQTSFKPPVHLVPIHNEGRLPSYFIVAGLVFVPVCQPYIVSDVEPEDSDWSLRLLERARNGVAEFDDEQIVVMSQVLANDLNIGYEDITNAQILKKRQGNNQFWGKAKVQNFNGVKIRNLKQLAQLVDSCTDEFMCFQLDETMMVVLDTKASHLATPQILKDYSIPLERSQDLINLT
ncbi:hypothetical protein O6H91_09G004900 [Diphasiastrum complanatum]|uniref:Uncharacterized protein n=1 Tax=Diphasiastrum complanatum TaxID=34168 RepID=A0ACC2CL05_DIPCM|nr:hypothetical protein O6H91_09G004900 [Diphasiastrum complanatum]